MFKDKQYYRVVDDHNDYIWHDNIPDSKIAIALANAIFKQNDWNKGTKLHVVEVNEELYDTYEKE